MKKKNTACWKNNDPVKHKLGRLKKKIVPRFPNMSPDRPISTVVLALHPSTQLPHLPSSSAPLPPPPRQDKQKKMKGKED